MALEPDVKQAIAFFAALYPRVDGSSIHFRGVAEPKDGRAQHNLHYALDEHFQSNLEGFLEWCNVDQRAAFFLPGTVKGTGTGKKDVLSLPAVLVDFDKGNPDENLAAVEALIGPATVIVESGGVVDGVRPKLHAYWRLADPATLADVTTACAVREALAVRFGGDTAFKQAAQVIRVPGSIHFKGEPKLVKLRRVKPEASYALADLVAKVPSAAPAPTWDFFDFSRVDVTTPNMDRVLTEPVHEGGVDDITRFEAASKAIGHFIRMVREGRLTPEQAWTATCEWNAATLVPPWDEDRLRNDFERLVRADVGERGPLVAVTPVAVQTTAEGWSISDWRADRFKGEPPARVWLVEGMIPAGTAGVFAAVGDAGKSMMALRLALQVATSPVVPAGPISVANPTFFGQEIIARGSAVVLTAEDDADEVHRRLAGLDPSFGRRDKPLYVVPMLATGGTPAIIMNGPAGPVLTQFWSALKDELRSIPDLRLVVLDPLSAFAAGDTNDNQFGTALMMELGKLASETGAAVMLVHHFAKATVPTDLTDARGAIRGAGALVDNGRWSIVMWEAGEDDAYKALKALGQPERARAAGIVYKGGLAKGNAPGAKTLRTLVRNSANGVLEDQTDAIIAAAPRRDEVDDAVLAALRDYKARYVRWNFKRSQKSLREVYHIVQQAKVVITQKAMDDCIGRLVQCGLVVEDDSPGVYIPNMDQ